MKSEKYIIEKTKDYDRFQVYTYNRPINRSLVLRLKDSINKIGYIDAKPILVDEEFTIIDGQHRYMACVELEIPISYSIVKGNPEEIIINLNSQQINWKLADFVHCWAEREIECYVKLKEFEEKHRLGMSMSLMVLFSNHVDKADYKKVKAGKEFTINPDAQKICEFIYANSSVPYNKNSIFVKSIIKLFKIATPEQISKVQKYLISLPQQATVANYMVAFENIVNKNIPMKNRISFGANLK